MVEATRHAGAARLAAVLIVLAVIFGGSRYVRGLRARADAERAAASAERARQAAARARLAESVSELRQNIEKLHAEALDAGLTSPPPRR